jgi:UDP-2,3-diacylglucosamine pyrophosphatase LpxH
MKSARTTRRRSPHAREPRAHAPAASAHHAASAPARRWRTIWISDTHLGTRACRAELLLDFLRQHQSEFLYLVGDIVDGWSLRRSWYWNDDHNQVLRTILDKSSRGTRVTYVQGNHDEFLREFAGLMLGGIAVKPEAVHRTASGRELLVFHGDRFDLCIRNALWLSHLGDHAYRVCRLVGSGLDLARRRLGLRPWSLADWLKQRVKSALAYVDRFERAVAGEARRRGLDGVVCGHVHHAAIRDIDGILYCNDGDWVDSCTALVEDFSGRLSILQVSRAAASPALERAGT